MKDDILAIHAKQQKYLQAYIRAVNKLTMSFNKELSDGEIVKNLKSTLDQLNKQLDKLGSE